MNENAFAKLHKELVTVGDLIRARQEEKQGLLDEFTAESKRFFFGKISERSLAASVKRNNKGLLRLNKGIKDAMARMRSISANIGAFLFKACSNSSRTTIPAPSAITKPSRFKSNGLEAFSGVSFLRLSALRAEKPETPKIVVALSVPPAIMTSASPSAISFAA